MDEAAWQIIAKLKQETYEVDDVKFKMTSTEVGDVTVIYFSSLVEKMTIQTMVYIPLANNIKQIHQISEYVDTKKISDAVKKLNAGQTL